MYLHVLRLSVSILTAFAILIILGGVVSFWMGYWGMWFMCLGTGLGLGLGLAFLNEKIYELESAPDEESLIFLHLGSVYPAE